MIYRFLEFELDEERFELRKNGSGLPVQARVLRALAYLVSQRERVVSKDELLDAVWKDVAVSDTALSQVIMLARKALSDDAEQPALLKTVRGRGFRFTAEVQLVRTEPPQSAPVTELRSPLVGRRSELQLLQGFMDSALAGRGALVLLGGEPGIGKSCLVEAFAAEAAARGVDVLWGKAWEEGGAPPFWPFIQVLRALVERHGAGALVRFGGPQAEALTPLWSEASEPADGDGARNRFKLFDAMSRVLRGAAGRGKLREPDAAPRLVILEDLHACDAASLLLLRFIAGELAGSPLLIVASFRDLPQPQSPELRQLLASLPDAQHIPLGGLPESESLALLARRLGSEPPPRLAAALGALSGGNPLVVVELARQSQLGTLPQLEAAALIHLAVPERIGSAVSIHLGALPQVTLDALTSASALGRAFSQRVLAELLQISEPELLERLAPAFARGIVRDPGTATGELLFGHALVRNAVYAALSPLRRAELHRRIGDLLEARAGRGGAILYELAHHHHLAAAVGGKARAIEAALRAATHARELRAYELAAELSERALELTRLEGSGAEPLFARLFTAGEAWYEAGQLERAVSRFDEAAGVAREGGKPTEHALAVANACFVLRGVMLYDRARQNQICATLRALPETDDPIRASLLTVSMLGRNAPSELEERVAAARAGVAMARRLQCPATLAQALNCYHLALWGAVPTSELVQVADELLELVRDGAQDELMLDALIWRTVDSLELGDAQHLHRASEEYAARVQAHNGSWHRYAHMLCEAAKHTCLGDQARADALSEQARTLGQRQGEPLAEAFHAVRLLVRSLAAGTTSEVPAELAPPRDPPAALPAGFQTFWLWGWVRSGRTEQARAWLVRLAGQGFEDLPLDPQRKSLLACLARAAVELGELALAKQLYALLAPHAGLHLVLHAGVYLGPVSFHLGVVAAALGQPLAAAEHFEQVQAQCQQLGASSYLLSSQLEHARLLSRSALPLTATSGARLLELLGGAERLALELGRQDQAREARELLQHAQKLRPRLREAAS